MANGKVEIKVTVDEREALRRVQQLAKSIQKAFDGINVDTALFDDLASDADKASSSVDRLASSNDSASASFDRIGSSTNSAGANIDQLASNSDASSASMEQLGVSSEQVASGLEILGAELSQNASEQARLGSSIQSMSSTANSAGSVLSALGAEAERSGSSISQLASEASTSGAELERAGSSAESAGASFERTGSSADGVGSSMERAGASADSAGSSLERTGASAEKAGSGFEKAGSSSDSASASFDKVKGSADKATASVKSLVGALGLMKLVSAGINLISGSIDGAVKRFDTLSNSSKVFKNMGFEAKDTQKAMDDLNDSITGLPTPLDEAVSGVQMLATTTNGDLSKAQQVFSAINDAILGFGGNTADVNNAVLQLSQAFQSGKIDGMTWISMMNSQMGPTLNAMAKQMGITTDELKSGLSEGSISVAEFQDALIELDKEGGGGLESLQQIAQDATGGIQTSFQNMRTAVSRALEYVIGKFNELSVLITGNTIAGNIQELGNKLEGTIKSVGDTVYSMVNLLRPYLEILAEGLNRVWTASKDAFISILDALGLLDGSLLTSQSSLDAFGGAVDTVAGFVEKLSQWIQDNSEKIAGLIEKLPQLIAGFYGVKIGIGIFNGIRGAVGLLDGALRLIPGNTSTIGGAFEGMASRAIGAINGIGPVGSLIFGGLALVAGGAVFAITTDFWNMQDVATGALSAIGDGGGQLRGALSSAFSGINDVIVDFVNTLTLGKFEFENVGQIIMALGSVAFGGLAVAVALVVDVLIDFVNVISGSITILDFFGRTIDAIGTFLKEVFTEGVGTAKENFVESMGEIERTADDKLNSLEWSFGKTTQGVIDSLGEMDTSVQGSGNEANNMASQMQTATGLMASAFSNNSGTVVDSNARIVTAMQQVASQSQLTFQDTSVAMAQMGEVTTAQAGLIAQTYYALTGDVNGSMQLMAQGMVQNGTEGATGLLQALQAHDYGLASSMITDEVLAQLETLPPEMFAKGDDGKQKFIEALRNGDASEATAQLANTAKVGAESVDLSVTGQQKADEFNQGIGVSGDASQGQLLAETTFSGAGLVDPSSYLQPPVNAANAMVANGGTSESGLALAQGMMSGASGVDVSQYTAGIAEQANSNIANSGDASSGAMMADATASGINSTQSFAIAGQASGSLYARGLSTGFLNAGQAVASSVNAIVNLIRQQVSNFQIAGNQSGVGYATGLQQGLVGANSVVATVVASIGSALMAGTNNYAMIGNNAGMSFKTGLQTSLSSVSAIVANSLSSINAILMSTVSAFQSKGIQGGQGYSKGLQSGLNSSKVSVQGIINSLLAQMNGAIGKFQSAGNKQGQAYTKGFNSNRGQAINNARQMATGVKNALNALTGAIGQVGRTQGQKYVQGINSSRGTARSAGSAVAQAAKSGAQSVGGWSSIGYQMTAGIASGVRSGMGILQGAIRSVVSGAVATAKRIAQIHSPSRLFANAVGKFFPSGIAMGAEKNAGVLNDTMADIVTNSLPNLPDIDYNFKGLGAKIKNRFVPSSFDGVSNSTTTNTDNRNYSDNRQYVVNANGANSEGVELTPEFMRRLIKELAYYTSKEGGGLA